ncbi:hypothetical protein Dsin_014374 [Dipteronia sinensis]|uniref:Uncharacterized protein n=1 Tax=Dipteronia sinensis TaxID=43782 RepID=A0AAE0E9Y8_9ROSI|nr:hypothetical protein Dsin_014374 [Dipteronia sinensis]
MELTIHLLSQHQFPLPDRNQKFLPDGPARCCYADLHHFQRSRNLYLKSQLFLSSLPSGCSTHHLQNKRLSEAVPPPDHPLMNGQMKLHDHLRLLGIFSRNRDC